MSTHYNDAPPPPVDPYADEYSGAAGHPEAAPRGRTRSRSPVPRSNGGGGGYRSPPPYRRRSPPPARTARPPAAPIPQAPTPSNVLGVFGLSIRTQERDLDDEFSRFGRVEKVTIVYDQRSDRSRGFGFIKMSTVEEATRCIQELNGIELNGRRIRVDYSVTDRPHAPTPGEYMGHRRSARDSYYGRDARDTRDTRDSPRDYRERDRDVRRGDKERDPYGRDTRDWRERRSPPPQARGRYSPDRRRRSYSRSPPRGSSPRREYDAPAAAPLAPPPDSRW